MDVKDPVTELIFGLLQEKPRRLSEIQHVVPLSQYAVLHRMNKLEASHKVVAERNRAANSTTYRLADGEQF